MSRCCGAEALEEYTARLIHHTEDAAAFNSKLTADHQKISDAHIISGVQDLEVRKIVELSEKVFLPRCDPRSCALTDGFATVSLMTAPIQYYAKYVSSDLTTMSAMTPRI